MTRLVLCSLLFVLLALSSQSSSAQRFERLTVAAGPSPDARRQASAIHDPIGHRMVVFGGQTASGRVADIWALDLQTLTWMELTPASGPAPAGRRTPGSVYDPDAHRMVTWSGQGAGVFFNDVWSFDLDSNSWTEHAPIDTIPNPRYGVAAVFDPVAKELVTFAGFTNMGRFDDTWRFDPIAQQWTDARPGSGSPPMRCLHSASYDAVGHRMIMYGGQQAGPLDDIWALDFTSGDWSEITPTFRPAGRFFAAHVYDSRDRRSVVFGGTQGTNTSNNNEVWAFDLASESWEQLLPTGTAPSPRQGSCAIYVESEDRMVIFGGYDGSYLDEVWAVEDLSGGPTAVPSPAAEVRVAWELPRPNPFNPQTTLRFRLGEAGDVRVELFDLAGRRVARLLDESRGAGTHELTWAGVDDDGRAMPSGLYLARVSAQGEVATTKLVLAK